MSVCLSLAFSLEKVELNLLLICSNNKVEWISLSNVGGELVRLGIKIKGQAITTLRKMEIAEQHTNNPNMTDEQLVQHAHGLGQSPATNLGYVSQVKKTKSKK